jgi:hypothetical protein
MMRDSQREIVFNIDPNLARVSLQRQVRERKRYLKESKGVTNYCCSTFNESCKYIYKYIEVVVKKCLIRIRKESKQFSR